MNRTAEVINGVPIPADLDPLAPRPMLAVLDAKPGQRSALRAAIAELTRDVRREPGCRAFLAHTDHANPDRFYLYEVYDDLKAFTTHLRTPHVERFIATVGNLAVNGAGDVLVQLDDC